MSHTRRFLRRDVSRRLELTLWFIASLLVVLLVLTFLVQTAAAAV
jgi:type VI protein secretion system component VasF